MFGLFSATIVPNLRTRSDCAWQVTYSIEISKFSLAWKLNSAVADMCRTLGWHRLRTEQLDARDTKPAMFWFCYAMDKGLSLRFGRNSIFQDWDISIPRSSGILEGPWKNAFKLWIESASIQGEAYEQLYSPAALNRPPENRLATAKHLSDKLKSHWKDVETVAMIFRQHNNVRVGQEVADTMDREWRTLSVNMMLQAGEVGYWTSLCLVYRAIPSGSDLAGTYNANGIEAARMAFKCHEACIQLTSQSVLATVGYLHW